MGSIRNYSKANRCPICGEADWCGNFTDKDGFTRYIEMRYQIGSTHEIVIRCSEKGQSQYGKDGNEYVFLGQSDKGNSYQFMSRHDWERKQQQRQREYEDWCRANGYKPNPTKYVSTPLPESSMPAPAPERRDPVEVDHVDCLPNDLLDRVFRAMDHNLILEDRHRDYLRSEGWSDDMISHFHVKSFPEGDYTRYQYRKSESKNPYRKALAQKIMDETGFTSLRGVPGAYQTDKGDWTFTGNSGLIFFLPDEVGQFYRGRIRCDFRDVNGPIQKEGNEEYYVRDGKRVYISMKGYYSYLNGQKVFEKGGGKYRNLSSFREDEDEFRKGFIVNKYKQGCRSGNCLGFYVGQGNNANVVVHVTEGEKKGAFSSYVTGRTFISVPGVDSWPLLFKKSPATGMTPIEWLKSRGCKSFIVAYDADKATNLTVLDRQDNAAQALLDASFQVGIANWDAKDGKGIDDLFANGLSPSYSMWTPVMKKSAI